MLIKRQHLEAIGRGEITLAFRRWKRPTVRAGGTLRTSIGVLAIERLEVVAEDQITEADARSAGFSSREELIAALRGRREGELYRIALRLAGPDPRRELRQRTAMTAEEVAELSRRLARYDAASRSGPWTSRALRLIAENPGTRAADLAARAGLEKRRFKANVRKLKELGLTESLNPGYRLSPRGRSYLNRVGRQAPRSTERTT